MTDKTTDSTADIVTEPIPPPQLVRFASRELLVAAKRKLKAGPEIVYNLRSGSQSHDRADTPLSSPDESERASPDATGGHEIDLDRQDQTPIHTPEKVEGAIGGVLDEPYVAIEVPVEILNQIGDAVGPIFPGTAELSPDTSVHAADDEGGPVFYTVPQVQITGSRAVTPVNQQLDEAAEFLPAIPADFEQQLAQSVDVKDWPTQSVEPASNNR